MPSLGRRPFVGAVMLIALLHGTSARGQQGQDSSIVGTVRDASGAVVPDAAITVSSPQLVGGARSTTSDARGGYRLVFLAAGDYDITVARPGFARTTRMGVTLQPGLMFTIDVTLALAAMADAVDVRSESPVIDVRTSSAPTLIDRQLLEHLPLPKTTMSGLGTVADAVNLAPGVVQSVALGGTFLSNPLSLDGANGNEPGYGTPTLNPNVNWFDELQVISVGADAQYGEYTGAIVNAVTRSGSNRFSGLADYWTTRPSWTGNNRAGLTPQLQASFRPVQVADRWDSDVQAGGPLVRDRVWFFAGGEFYRDAYWPTTFRPGSNLAADPKRDSADRKFIVKLTAAIAPALRVEGFVNRGADDVSGNNAAPLVAPEALARLDTTETAWNTRLLWTLGSRTNVEVRSAGHDASLFNGPSADRLSAPPAHIDLLTGARSQNVSGVGQAQNRPVAASAAVTSYAAGFAGEHQLKFGFELEHSSSQSSYGYVGGRLYLDYGGRLDEVYLWDGAVNRATQSRRTLYAQDAWNVTGRLTINAGLRLDLYHGAVPTRDDAFSSHATSPRVGVAFDLAGDHRTVVRAHFGRYAEELVTSFYDFLDPLSQSPFTIASVAAPGMFVQPRQLPTAAQASIDPDLAYPYDQEYLVGADRQLPGSFSVRAQFIGRDFRDAIGFTDPARTWVAAQALDRGPDGKAGTADDGGPIPIYLDQTPGLSAPLLTNPAAAYRRSHAAQFVLSKRYAQTFELQASYTWSRTVGSYNNAAFANAANADLGLNGVFVNPNRQINTNGRTPQDFTHDVLLVGTYQLARWGGLSLGGVYRYQSGRPWARSAGAGSVPPQAETSLIFVEPRGTRELPAIDSFDLRLEKTWKPAKRAGTVGGFVDLFNAGNQGVALRVNNQSGPNLGVPTQWLDPRTVRAGLRLMF